MSLANRIVQLTERAQRLKTAQSGVNEGILLQTRLDEISDTTEMLSQQIELLIVFQKEGICISEVPSSLEEAKKRILKVQERFTKERKADNLTKGKDWQIMRQAVNEVAIHIKTNLFSRWKSYIENVYSGENPQNLQNILAPTDSNNSALSRYKASYDQLNNLTYSIPDSISSFKEVRTIGEQLKSIYTEFDFAVPASVKEFLTAVGSGGASLELLTQEVQDWLTDTGTDIRYRIVAKR